MYYNSIPFDDDLLIVEKKFDEIKNLIVQLIFVFRIITVYHLLLINIKLKKINGINDS